MSQLQFYNKELDLMQNQILALKKYIFSLHKRLALITHNYSLKNNFDKNEVDIISYETKCLITQKFFSLKSLEENFKNKLDEYNDRVKEVLTNYESLLHTIMNFYQDNVEIKHFLYPINWSKINNDFEQKMELYFNLKNLIEKQQKTKV